MAKLTCFHHLAFDWAKLPTGSVVVDVGGGVGTACLSLAERYPDLKLVVQDLSGIINNAHEVGRFSGACLIELGAKNSWKGLSKT